MNRFLVPFNRNKPHLCFASRVMAYIHHLNEDIPDVKPDEGLFRKPMKSGSYSRQVLGKHTLAGIGKEIAEELGLEKPETYTGHCFRCSSATAAANHGANTVELKRHFGWVQESTALKYVDDTKERSRKMARLITGENKNSTKKDTAMTSTAVTTVTATTTTEGNENENGIIITSSQTHGTVQIHQSGKDSSTAEDAKKKVYNFDMKGASVLTLHFN